MALITALGPVIAGLGRGDVLVVAKLDRLSRPVADFAGLVKRSIKEGWRIMVLDLGVDMTTHHGRLVANVRMAVAQWERRAISRRVREGLAQSTKTLGRYRPANGGGRQSPADERVLAAVRDGKAEGLSPRRRLDRPAAPRLGHSSNHFHYLVRGRAPRVVGVAKGTPVARRGRKARGLSQIAQLPLGKETPAEEDGPTKGHWNAVCD
jgi:resolvase-like protein